MSYDVMVVKFAGKRPATPLDMQAAEVTSLGAAAQVRRSISVALPGTDWSDPTWGMFDGDGFSIEFNVGGGDPVGNIMLHLRGGGDALAAAARLATQMGCAAIDCQTDKFLDLAAPADEG